MDARSRDGKLEGSRIASHLEELLGLGVDAVELLDPAASAAMREDWWRAFLPGFERETKVREAVLSLKVQVPRA